MQMRRKKTVGRYKHLMRPLLKYGDFKSGQRGMLNGKYEARLDGIAQVYFQDPDSRWIEVNDAKFRDKKDECGEALFTGVGRFLRVLRIVSIDPRHFTMFHLFSWIEFTACFSLFSHCIREAFT